MRIQGVENMGIQGRVWRIWESRVGYGEYGNPGFGVEYRALYPIHLSQQPRGPSVISDKGVWVNSYCKRRTLQLYCYS